MLIERLARGIPRPVVSVVAPAGFGKTTLLSQWAEHDGRAFAWVSVEEPDNDPKVLLTYVAEALDAVEPIDGRVFDALASPGSSVLGSAVPRLGSAFSSMTSPVVLLLDDVHTLHNSECRAALAVLADHVQAGSRLALAGRAPEPPLRVARLRAEGRILEIGPEDLSLTRAEASSLLRNTGVTLGKDEVAELHRRTEGWPTGLYLAALYLKEGGSLSRAVVTFGGANRLVSDYVEAELLSRISQRQRVFLTRTAVLDRLSGPLCEAVLEPARVRRDAGGPRPVEHAAGTAGPAGRWYRYHHLFRDMLLGELRRHEPGLMPVLRCGRPPGTPGRAFPRKRWSTRWRPGMSTRPLAWWRDSWCRPTARPGPDRPAVAWVAGGPGRGRATPDGRGAGRALLRLTGRPVEAERWADAVDRWQYGGSGAAR